jgi:hypothetical protein
MVTHLTLTSDSYSLHLLLGLPQYCIPVNCTQSTQLTTLTPAVISGVMQFGMEVPPPPPQLKCLLSADVEFNAR